MSSLYVFSFSVVLVIIDQIIKFIVSNNLSKEISILGGWISFIYVKNFGAAFGILRDRRYIFIISTIIILTIFIYIIAKSRKVDYLLGISASLIIGGGIGNMVDRLLKGYVIDYIKIIFFPAVCNFADYCITIGVMLLIIRIMTYKDRKEISN